MRQLYLHVLQRPSNKILISTNTVYVNNFMVYLILKSVKFSLKYHDPPFLFISSYISGKTSIMHTISTCMIIDQAALMSLF